MDVQKFITRYRWPLLAGAGGLAAVSAYQQSRAQQAAAAAAAAGAAGGLPAGTTAAEALAIAQQGANLYGSGQAPLLGLAQGGLDAATTLGSGAQALAGLATGNLAGAVSAIGDLAGTALGILPSFAPSAGVQPQPTQPAPVTQPPSSGGGGGGGGTTPAPAETFVGYEAVMPIGSYILFDGTGKQRAVRHDTLRSNRASRVTFGAGNWLGWRYIAGGYTGWMLLPGRSGGPWYVNRLYQRAGSSTLRRVNIGQNGS